MNDYTEIIKSIRALAQGKQPDLNISKLLYEHNCFYFLSKIREQDEYTQKSKTELQLNQICIKERYISCRPVFEMLENMSVSYAVIKGAVLSKTAYGDINVRKSGDIDLLIRRDDIDSVKKLMLQNGFIQGRVTDAGLVPFTRQELIFQTGLSHQAAPFIRKGSNSVCPYINVDVNMDILWGESKRQSDMEFVLSQTENIDICGVSVQKLTPVVEFISLCLHHYKDMNSVYLLAERSLKLGLFCDIYFYLRNNNLEITELKDVFEKLNVTEYIYYCIYYANKVFNDEIFHSYLIALKNEKTKDILNAFGLDDHERKSWYIPFEERLFNENFKNKFMALLDENDKEKIRLNTLLF